MKPGHQTVGTVRLRRRAESGRMEGLAPQLPTSRPSCAPAVLHVITGLDRGGAEAVLVRVVEGTRDRYTHCVVSLLDEGVHGQKLRAMGIPVHTLRMARGRAGPASFMRLLKIIGDEKPDLRASAC